MKLQYSPNSPYVRKVVLLALELGLNERIVRDAVTLSPYDPNPAVVQLNPLGKIPVLEAADGMPLFDGSEPSETTRDILGFCEQFEQAGARTNAFVQELNELDLLMDGEVAIQADGYEQPFVYRGFRMVDENKLRDLRGDTLRKLSQNGILPLLYAHLFSLSMMRELFAEQMAQGKVPAQMAAQPTA